MSNPLFQVQDQNGSPYQVSDLVNVRCIVNSITGGQGAGGRVNLTVETPGVLGQISNVSFAVSPIQVRRMQGGISQPLPTSATQGTTIFLGERDVESSPFNVGDVVAVRARVTAISGSGASAIVSCLIENAGNVGETSGVTFNVSPSQTRRARELSGVTLPGA